MTAADVLAHRRGCGTRTCAAPGARAATPDPTLEAHTARHRPPEVSEPPRCCSPSTPPRSMSPRSWPRAQGRAAAPSLPGPGALPDRRAAPAWSARASHHGPGTQPPARGRRPHGAVTPSSGDPPPAGEPSRSQRNGGSAGHLSWLRVVQVRVPGVIRRRAAPQGVASRRHNSRHPSQIYIYIYIYICICMYIYIYIYIYAYPTRARERASRAGARSRPCSPLRVCETTRSVAEVCASALYSLMALQLPGARACCRPPLRSRRGIANRP